MGRPAETIKDPDLSESQIIAALADGAWAKDNDGATCPKTMTPKPQELAAWFPECPNKPMREAVPRLEAVFDHVIAKNPHDPDSTRTDNPSPMPKNFEREVSWKLITFFEQPRFTAICFIKDLDAPPEHESTNVPGPFLYTLDILHGHWASIPDGERPQHPLAPIIRAWQIRPIVTKPFLPKSRASMPSLQTIDHENITLPDFPASDATAQGSQMALPGFEPAVTMCPSWLLWLYDRAGGESMTAGRGAPWDLHLFVSSFLHLGIDQRDGHWKTLRFPHLVEHEADWSDIRLRSR